VKYGESLGDDLLRRDFTVNAMAVTLPTHELVDPFGGLADLRDATLRTPGTPQDSFDDDPLRILRAARFVADHHQWFQAGSSGINGGGISGAAGSQNYDVVYRCVHSIYGNKQGFLLYM